VDTLAPELRRTDQGEPGDISLIPGQNETLAGHEFPRSVLAFVEDYDQPRDPAGGGPFGTLEASGVDIIPAEGLDEAAGKVVDLVG